MPNISMPNGDVVAFPDDMPKEEIKNLIAQKFPEVVASDQAQPQAPRISKAESALTGAAQGMSANFGDELIAGLSAPVAYGGSRLLKKFGVDTKGLSEMPLKDIYRMEQQKGQKGVKEAEKANPIDFLGGEIGGSIYGAGKFAKTKTGTALANYLSKGGLTARMAKAIPAGAASGAIYGAGNANPDNIAGNAKDSALAGMVVAPLAPVIGSIARKFAPKTPKPNADQVKEMAGEAYQTATKKGGVLNEAFTDKFLAKTANIMPQTEAGKLLAGDSVPTKIVEKLQGLRNKKLNLDEVQEIDEFLGEVVDELSDKGVMTKQARKVLNLQTDLRNLVENASEEDVFSKSTRLKSNQDALNQNIEEWNSLNQLKRKLEIDTQNNYNIAQGINKTANSIPGPADKLRYYQTIGFEKANKPEITEALKELDSLKAVEQDLINSVKGNTKTSALINLDSSEKLGFWRNRSRSIGDEFLKEAVPEAKNLANIRKQITDQENVIKKQVSQISNDFLSDSAADAKNINNVRKQITDQEKRIRSLEKENSEIAKSELETGKEGFEALKQGRQLWSRSAKLRDVEKIISRAEMTDNPATAIKTGFRTLYHNPARMRGFTADEKKLIKKAAESGVITDILRTFGSRLNPIISLGSGGSLGATAAAQVGSMASRGIATKVQTDKAEKLANAIAGKVLPPSVPKLKKYPMSVPVASGLIGYKLGNNNQ